jgi:hypothetical protein
MILRKPKPEDLKLINAINDCLDELDTFGPDDPGYVRTLASLERLMDMQKAKKPPRTFSSDTMLLVAGNLLGILIIVAYEQKHVMTSKAQGFLLKTR